MLTAVAFLLSILKALVVIEFMMAEQQEPKGICRGAFQGGRSV
jgi:hypothetical protein